MNMTELALFRKYRFSRIQRQYENVWCWKDVNIGPHGRFIFNLPVPARPAHWMVSAFSMSPSLGFGMLNKAIEVSATTKKLITTKKNPRNNLISVCGCFAVLYQRGNAE